MVPTFSDYIGVIGERDAATARRVQTIVRRVPYSAEARSEAAITVQSTPVIRHTPRELEAGVRRASFRPDGLLTSPEG